MASKSLKRLRPFVRRVLTTCEAMGFSYETAVWFVASEMKKRGVPITDENLESLIS